MISSILQEVLMPVSFGSLLCLMLLYWGQAALFSYTKYSKLTTVLFFFSFISLTTLLIFRWVDSGHFPLSNLYESLLFLSWSFLGIQLVAQSTLSSSMPEPVELRCAETDRPEPPTAETKFRLPPKEASRAEIVLQHGFAEGEPRATGTTFGQSAEINLAGPTHISVSKFFEAKADFALREVSQRQLLHLLGVITSPMALLTYGFAFLNLPREMQKATALVPALQSNWLMMHVTIMILSYAALLCGSIFSMVFLLLTSLNTSSPHLQTVSKPGADVPNGNTRTDEVAKRLTRAPFRQAEGFSFEVAERLTGTTFRPKLCFSNRLELHDWALRAQTQASHAGGRLLNVAKQPNSKVGSALNLQDLALLSSKTQIAGSTFIDLWAVTKTKPNFKKAESSCSAKLSTDPKRLKTPYLSLAERLDNYSYRVLALGFPLLTVGILSGAVWANEAWGSYWSWDPKETWALITWLVFAIYLHARILKGWTGRKPAIIATFGFFVVWFCYLGVNLLGTGLHSYGWFSN